MSFRVGGRLAALNVDEGDTLKAGDTLGTLDQAPYQIALAQAQANEAAAQAKYDLIMAGYRSEEIATVQIDYRFIAHSPIHGGEAGFYFLTQNPLNDLLGPVTE